MSSPNGRSQPPSPKKLDSNAPPPQPALLPAFEPCSSSPSLPRPQKRKFDGSPCSRTRDLKQYPTPVPTSSTNVLQSPPAQIVSTRPSLNRSMSGVSERVPLGNVPSVVLPEDGEPILMGRSSNSSHYQLSACRLISRVHMSAFYQAPTEQHEHGQVLLKCLGWNGAKVHCRGQVHQLQKGDTFSSSKPQGEIMLDVQDARVIIMWPNYVRKGSGSTFSDTTWDDEGSPRDAEASAADQLPSSPPVIFGHLQSPVSPSPRQRGDPTASTTFLGLRDVSSPTRPTVEVYEDHESGDEASSMPLADEKAAEPDVPRLLDESLHSSSSSKLSEPEDYSDHNEENDPIVHSFGPFGDNLLPRMASFQAVSPERRRPLRASVSPGQPSAQMASTSKRDYSPVKNHVINQLAFSRLHALPLSTILGNLPKDLKTERNSEEPTLTEQDLKGLLDAIPCVGEIQREGKDAAGKPLEDEFYYIPQMDHDEMRKTAVEGSLGKPGLRAVRKQHKQYYWKRPRN